MNFSRPFGTWSIRILFPTLKRWAIVARSLRDSRRVSNWIQPRTGNIKAPQVSPQRVYSFVTQGKRPMQHKKELPRLLNGAIFRP